MGALASAPGAWAAEVRDDHCLAAHVPATDDVRIVRITSSGPKGAPAILQLQTFGRRTKTSRRVLLRFSDPAELRDSSLLVVDEDGDLKFYVSSPELGTGRVLAGPEVGTRLLGTDFGWEDVLFAQGLLGWEGASRLRHERLAERETEVLELRPAPGTSNYARVVGWIDVDSCLPLRLEMYGAKDRLVRTLATDPTSIIQIGSFAIPHETTIRDVHAETESTALIQAVIPGLAIPDRILQPDELGRYRPRVILHGDDHRPAIEIEAVE